MPGFIRISRDWFDDPSFASVKFSRPMALIDLVQMARYKAGTEFVNGRPVRLERGQLCRSVRWLAARWRWDEKTVASFISSLENGGVITKTIPHSRGGLTSIISIVNYDCFDDDSNTDSHSPSHTDSHNPSNTLNKEKENKRIAKEEKKEEDTIVSPKKERVDFALIHKLWNETMTRTRKIPKVASISPARKEKINLRVAEMGGWETAKETIANCFRKINESDFCNGENDNVWVATFDWFFTNEKNWLKVIEGNYDNRQRRTQLELFAENITKAHEYYGRQYGYGGSSAYGNPAGGREDSPDEQ